MKRIRARHAAGESARSLAAAFGVRSRTTIALIVQGHTWKEVA